MYVTVKREGYVRPELGGNGKKSQETVKNGDMRNRSSLLVVKPRTTIPKIDHGLMLVLN